MILEGVVYHRYQVRFRLADGRYRRWVRWSPSERMLRWEIARELRDRLGVDAVKPHSVTTRNACCCYECSISH